MAQRFVLVAAPEVLLWRSTVSGRDRVRHRRLSAGHFPQNHFFPSSKLRYTPTLKMGAARVAGGISLKGVHRQREFVMGDRFSGSIVTAAISAAAIAAFLVSVTPTSAQTPPASGGADAEDAVGRTRSAGHLDRRNRHAVPALAKYREPGILHRGATGRIGQRRDRHGRDNRGARGSERDVSGAYNDDVLCAQAHRPAHVDDRRSAQRPHPGDDAGGAEDRRPPIGNFRLALMQSTRDLQDQAARLRRRQIRSDALAATRRVSAALQHRAHEPQ